MPLITPPIISYLKICETAFSVTFFPILDSFLLFAAPEDIEEMCTIFSPYTVNIFLVKITPFSSARFPASKRVGIFAETFSTEKINKFQQY